MNFTQPSFNADQYLVMMTLGDQAKVIKQNMKAVSAMATTNAVMCLRTMYEALAEGNLSDKAKQAIQAKIDATLDDL
jgi:hypothetical protein